MKAVKVEIMKVKVIKVEFIGEREGLLIQTPPDKRLT